MDENPHIFSPALSVGGLIAVLKCRSLLGAKYSFLPSSDFSLEMCFLFSSSLFQKEYKGYVRYS